MKNKYALIGLPLLLCSLGVIAADASEQDVPDLLLWGDTHVHTNNSIDALIYKNFTIGPEEAYRFARGEPVLHPLHQWRVQLETPLDFLVIADHVEVLGVAKEIYFRGPQFEDPSIVDTVKGWIAQFFIRRTADAVHDWEHQNKLVPEVGDPMEEIKQHNPTKLPNKEALIETTWNDHIAAADAYNEPGVFTSFIGWEWTSIPGGANLHRVVISTADQEKASQFKPFGASSSPYPEDLWSWMDETSVKLDMDFLSIPHNSNISKGLMFAEHDMRGRPLSKSYLEKRARWEKLVEVTQVKGDSETHPALSPRDEFADFEEFPFYLQKNKQEYIAAPGDYARSALKTGLKYSQEQGINPFEFGMIGSTDSHTGLATAEEKNFHGKLATEGTPAGKTIEGAPEGVITGWSMSASGLAAVWSKENTREAIFDAMKRREVYATTGSRIGLRFFAGWELQSDILDQTNFAELGYQRGVPMGGVLNQSQTHGDTAPSFAIVATRDVKEANLDRIQVIKGWVDDGGELYEQVYDVAWSGAREPDAAGKLPAVGSSVDLRTGRTLNIIGAEELKVYWTDPAFDSQQPAFYYVRVLQIPTVRHTYLDARALGLDAPPEGDTLIQERAYSSPVWYYPKK